MARDLTFTLRVDAEERAMVERLARRLQRTQSDVVRLLVRMALADISLSKDEVEPRGEESVLTGYRQ